MSALVIAIDGPSGSGKSSVARAVAAKLGLAYLDTGAMYRAATWWLLESGIDLDDRPAVVAALGHLPLQIATDPAAPSVLVDGRSIDAEIRQTRISTVVSKVATNVPARAVLVAWQQRLIAQECAGGFSGGRGVVAEGRDITTVVAPQAPVRILLTASEHARLSRRAAELHGETSAAALASTEDQVLRRDRQDSTVVNFTTAADGVTTIDSTDFTLDQTIEAVLAVAQGVRS